MTTMEEEEKCIEDVYSDLTPLIPDDSASVDYVIYTYVCAVCSDEGVTGRCRHMWG